jgi:pSer/pThr/pTyr-binding forkhead associated (FHA) protein
MQDGRTRRVPQAEKKQRDSFLERHVVSIVHASGPLAGSEVFLEQARLTVGRDAKLDIVLDDASVSHQHAALELGPRGFRIRDLGSTNGVRVNGARVASADLEHGDRFALGSLEFCYVVEPRKAQPPTHSVHGG